MNIFDICGNSALFSKFKHNRDHSVVRCSSWTKNTVIGGPTGTVKAYVKLTRQPALERIIRKADPRSNKAVVNEPTGTDEVEQAKVKQPVSVAEAEKNTENMINAFATNRLMRELLESASFFAGAETMGGARLIRRSREQITSFRT